MTVSFDLAASAHWHHLNQLAATIDQQRIADRLAATPERAQQWRLKHGGILFDYTKNLATEEVLQTLVALADEAGVPVYRDAMFRGEHINQSERRPALHTALRAQAGQLQTEGLADLVAPIEAQLQAVRRISDTIRAGRWLGATGKPITDVINLGIGGSDLGPKMVCQALKAYASPSVHCHFVSNVDGEVIRSLLARLNPETTLIIIASKTFTTQETLLNAQTAARWLQTHLKLAQPFASNHVVGITANRANAAAMGLQDANIIEFWDWVGGRYSLWSSIGLAIAIAVGADNFERLRKGARQMDEHFRTAPLASNMPVLMALLGVWYTTFLHAESYAVIPYCERLADFPFYLQQLDMESNGKSVRHDGQPVTYATGPILWGLTGTNGQHSFFQLLHQGTHLVPVDFIGVVDDSMSAPAHHRVLLANMLAQSAALMTGKQSPQEPAYKQYAGNRPSNVLLLDELTPETLGALIALYEHKVLVQSCIWGINAFDQWGVELGKALASTLLERDLDRTQLDPSTQHLLRALDQ